MTRWLILCVLFAIGTSACGGSDPVVQDPVDVTNDGNDGPDEPVAEREPPPDSGPAREISFPPIARAEVGNGLEVNTVEWHQLPIVYLRLVVKSGGEADPADMPGMAHLVGNMLKEGTRRRSSAQIADQVDFLGADLWVESDEETISIGMRALSEHLDEAMGILADVTMNPAFRDDELQKLKRRELDRLSLQSNDPNFLASREFYRALYGEHPYGRIDTNREVVEQVSRRDLSGWHRQHFVANNAFLVAVGDVTADQIQTAAGSAFGRWRNGTVPEAEYATPPERDSREIILVDRPESVQSVISIGNLAIERSHADYVPLRVANQVLGGSAASRLFMDLRERRSLTYGAYSGIGESVQVAPFRARAAVRNEVTAEAMTAFFEHLDRIRTEATPGEELQNAHRYLSDSFPLRVDTPGKIAWLVANLRIFGLADDYWDSYRSSVREVSAEQALAAAQRHIRPESALVVVVGKAADVAETLRRYGPVRVLNADGEEQQRFEQLQ
ncbi:MAG: pitrilysin family protein [Myxococcota bacterium]